MSKQESPLEQLKDIHLPETSQSFEMAIGWWGLVILALLLLIYFIFNWQKKRQRLALLNPIKNEINQLKNTQPDSHAVAKLSALMKRVCLLYFPKRQVASLTGVEWADFLNAQSQQIIFDNEHKNIFTDIAYQPKQNQSKKFGTTY